jgi:hypothetical protein
MWREGEGKCVPLPNHRNCAAACANRPSWADIVPIARKNGLRVAWPVQELGTIEARSKEVKRPRTES